MQVFFSEIATKWLFLFDGTRNLPINFCDPRRLYHATAPAEIARRVNKDTAIMSDSEVLAIGVLGDMLEIDSENALVSAGFVCEKESQSTVRCACCCTRWDWVQGCPGWTGDFMGGERLRGWTPGLENAKTAIDMAVLRGQALSQT